MVASEPPSHRASEHPSIRANSKAEHNGALNVVPRSVNRIAPDSKTALFRPGCIGGFCPAKRHSQKCSQEDVPGELAETVPDTPLPTLRAFISRARSLASVLRCRIVLPCWCFPLGAWAIVSPLRGCIIVVTRGTNFATLLHQLGCPARCQPRATGVKGISIAPTSWVPHWNQTHSHGLATPALVFSPYPPLLSPRPACLTPIITPHCRTSSLPPVPRRPAQGSVTIYSPGALVPSVLVLGSRSLAQKRHYVVRKWKARFGVSVAGRAEAILCTR